VIINCNNSDNNDNNDKNNMMRANKIHTKPSVIAVANRPLGQKDENRACPAASQRMMVRCATELAMKYTRDILRETALLNFELQEYPQ